MAALALDPNPKNELGKGIFSPEVEADLLADGFVFGCKLPNVSHLPFGVLTICKRNIADAVTDQELDSPRGALRAQAQPVPTP